jgi:hypothetical protein
MVLLDSVGAELVGQHVGPGDKFILLIRHSFRLPRARAPALARQRTFGALARWRKLKVTNTTMYSGTLDASRVFPTSA